MSETGKLFALMLLLLVMSLVHAGCGGDSSGSPDGDVADGDMADGDMTDGDIVDGDVVDGDIVDGDVVDAEETARARNARGIIIGGAPNFAVTLEIIDGISIYGGYTGVSGYEDRGPWHKTPSLRPTWLVSGEPGDGMLRGVLAVDIALETVLSNVDITVELAAPSTAARVAMAHPQIAAVVAVVVHAPAKNATPALAVVVVVVPVAVKAAAVVSPVVCRWACSLSIALVLSSETATL